MSEIRPVNKVQPVRRPGQYSTALKAIRSKCLDCACFQAVDVALCPMTYCPLWPYRFGTGTRARRIIKQERTLTDVPDRYWAEQVPDYIGQAYYKPQDVEDDEV